MDTTGDDEGGLPRALVRSPIPTGLVAADGTWHAMNDALQALLGPTPPPFATIVDEPSLDLRAVLASADAGVTLHVALPDGTPAEGVVTPWTPSGDVRWLVQLLDRSELDRVAGVAEDALTAFDGFVSRVSHDLRNPIGTALGFSELLLADPALGDDVRGFAQRIHSSVARAAELLAALVVEARTTARVEPPDEVDVAVVVDRIRAELDGLLAGRRATVATSGTLPRLRTDERLLHRALSAAVRNAVEHHPGGAAVEVSARPVARGWELIVDDDGPGLSAADREAVLAPGVTAGGAAGAGLGLSLARAAVERRGGTLLLEANPAGGLRVRIVLPQRRASDPEVAREP